MTKDFQLQFAEAVKIFNKGKLWVQVTQANPSFKRREVARILLRNKSYKLKKIDGVIVICRPAKKSDLEYICEQRKKDAQEGYFSYLVEEKKGEIFSLSERQW